MNKRPDLSEYIEGQIKLYAEFGYEFTYGTVRHRLDEQPKYFVEVTGPGGYIRRVESTNYATCWATCLMEAKDHYRKSQEF